MESQQALDFFEFARFFAKTSCHFFAARSRACLQLRRMAAQARWTAARKILASLS